MSDYTILEIHYNDHGVMQVVLENFFPTGPVKTKKLIKIVEMDYLHRAELKRQIKQYLDNELKETISRGKSFYKSWGDYHQRACDLRYEIEYKRHPNGLRITKDYFEKAQKDLKMYEKQEKENLRIANSYDKLAVRLKKSLDLIEECLEEENG